jgi:hypothetical protein
MYSIRVKDSIRVGLYVLHLPLPAALSVSPAAWDAARQAGRSTLVSLATGTPHFTASQLSVYVYVSYV